MKRVASNTGCRRTALAGCVLLAGLICLGLSRPAVAGGKLRAYKTKYYTIYSDLPAERVAEAKLRIERMAEAYYQRTKGFAGRITKRLPFYLFSDPADYYAAGGVRGSAGLFDGKKLMMIAGSANSPATWRVMQHEGFHQFVAAVIGGRFPAWVNEGMAEYFGDSVFTGDGYVTGVIPPERLARLQRWIAEGHTVSMSKMLKMTQGQWNAQLSITNYDQAWSMIYFLAHADNGKYQPRLNAFIRDVSHGTDPSNAWTKEFGRGTARAFEQRWRDYWSKMPPDPTADLYAKATVAKITSFYARTFSQRQTFRSFETFLEAARSGKLRQAREDWLPPGLLTEALREVPRAGTWQIEKLPGRFQVVCIRPDGTRLIGTFRVANQRVVPGSVKVIVRTPRGR